MLGYTVKDLKEFLSLLPDDMAVVTCNPVNRGDNKYTYAVFDTRDGRLGADGYAYTSGSCPDGEIVKCLFIDEG